LPTRTERALLWLLLTVGIAPTAAAGPFDPRLQFRTLHSEHFAVHFHQGEERLAARLSAIAEDVWSTVGRTFQVRPPPLTHVIVADQTELASGWATPLPYNTIFIAASAPSGSEFIGRSDDWLRLVFTHEFTHIVHLDRSGGWSNVVRALFGRTLFSFPNLFLPAWQVEGLATWEESALGGEGRLHAPDFRAIEREAAQVGRVGPLDRINGGLTEWPGGLAPYAFGLGFHEYLANRFGAESFSRLAVETARSLPFLGSRAYRSVYGESLGALWSGYVSSLDRRTTVDQTASSVEPTRLTHHGYEVIGPRFAPPVCAACAQSIIYSVRGPHGFPALRSILPDGSGSIELATRYLGSTNAPRSDVIVFDQQELRRNAGLYSDLFTLDRKTRDVRELTREARLRDPDLSPDGRTLACVRERGGFRELVLLAVDPRPSQNVVERDPAHARTNSADQASPSGSLPAGKLTVLVSDADTQFDVPRWAPDGRALVAERHKPGRLSDIVIVDVRTAEVRPIAVRPDARFATPTWRPDGRAVVAAVEVGDEPFDLYEFSAEDPNRPPRRLTAMKGGAVWPDISPDGTTIVFVSNTPQGFDLFTMPYPGSGSVSLASPLSAEPIRPVEALQRGPRAAVAASASTYTPWGTLHPTSWTPIIEGASDQIRAGLALSGADVLGRHSYAGSATWLTNLPGGATAANRAAPDWQAFYGYSRWRPTFILSASRATIFGAGPADTAGRPTGATLRERDIQAGVLLPYRHVRTDSRAFFSVVKGSYDYTLARQRASLDRAAVRAAWAVNTSHVYGYSIGPERGLTFGTTAELTRVALGASADATVVTADLRAYLPGGSDHRVVAIRMAGGASTGRADLGRTFHLGGAAPAGDVIDFTRDAFRLMRGFPLDTFAGSRVALMNAEYRSPLARPQRGVGTWPIFLHTISAAAFFDAGHTWSNRFSLHDAKIAAGGELAFNVIAGYSFPLTVAVGAAWGLDGAFSTNRGGRLYIRLGRSF
jgi:hypothetical protein